MNYQKLSGMVLVLMLCINAAVAQDHVQVNEPDHNKPRLFSLLPEKIEIDITDLQAALAQEVKQGKSIDFRFHSKNAAAFAGKIISAATRSDRSGKSVLIRPSQFNGATFALSSSTMADGTVRYSGRIISFKHGDAFELKEENGRYYLLKRNFYELVSE